ncbi:MAG: hypothetical protein RSE07_00920 [Oscillospiraceae bacterium]
MLKSFKMQSKYLMTFVGIVFAIEAVFIGFNLLVSPAGNVEFELAKNIGMGFAFCSIMPMMIIITMYTTYIFLSLQMGGTRKGFFLASQLTKVTSSIIFSALSVILMAITDYIILENTTTDSNETFIYIVIIISALIFLSTIGETVGLFILRVGKWGFLVFILIMAFTGGIIGFMIGFSSESGINLFGNIITFLENNKLFIAVGIMALSIVITGLNWLMMRKIVLK